MTYEYECGSCKQVFEVEQSIKDLPLTECQKCGAHDVKRLISGGGFQLKGDGWFRDGYSSSKEKA